MRQPDILPEGVSTVEAKIYGMITQLMAAIIVRHYFMLDKNQVDLNTEKGYAVVNYLGERPTIRHNGFLTVRSPSEVEVEIVRQLKSHSVSYFYCCKDISISELAKYIPSEIFAEYIRIESTPSIDISPVTSIPKYKLKLVRIKTTTEIGDAYAQSNVFVNKFGGS